VSDLKLADWLDPGRLAPIFQRQRRLHIPDALDPAAARSLALALAEATPWSRTLTLDGRSYDAPVETVEAMDEATRRDMLALVGKGAREGFQYDFETWRLSDAVEAGLRRGGPLAPLEGLYDFLNGEGFLGFVRALTGVRAAAYCDAQATRYRAGHFLTSHDDNVAGKARLFAYVLNLTPDWRPEWGGLLMFHDADGHVAEAYAPKFNALNIFSVPQVHSVSQVASYVTASRYAVTGWIREASARPGP
jgi:hypothetical protein